MVRFEELKTKEDIDGFVEASIEAAQDDTGPSLLAHALGVAAKARGMLETANETGSCQNGNINIKKPLDERRPARSSNGSSFSTRMQLNLTRKIFNH
jgi:hypothetical protein